MPQRIIGNDRKRGVQWFLDQFPEPPKGEWDKASALILEKDGDIQGVVVYNLFYPKDSVEISVAGVDGRWLTRPFLSAVFRTPFIEWGMRRVGSSIAADNIKSIRFCEHLGFVREGCIREGVAPGIDLLKYGLLHSECRFLGNLNVERRSTNGP